MTQRTIVPAFLLALFAGTVAASPPAAAQGTYYFPPKLAKQGTATSPIAGAGTVIVKVLVNADATFKVQNVIKSTNHGNDKAALEIAQTSKYKPASRGGKPVLAFYDFSLKFTATSVTSEEEGTPSTAGGLDSYDKMIRSGNYNGAKGGLTQYLEAHPGDAQASGMLGVAETYLQQYDAAVKSFDAAGQVPAKDAPSAALGYTKVAQAQADAKNGTAAVAAATKAVQYGPTVPTYNMLGFAQQSAGDYSSAATSFEKAASMAASDSKIDAKAKATIQGNLAAAYASGGNLDKAKAALAAANKLDPNSGAPSAVAGSLFKKGQDLEKEGKMTEAAAQYEAGAEISSKDGVTLYTAAALAYLNAKPQPDATKALADANKVLALDPNNARANFLAGVAMADQGKSKDAMTYLNKADAAAKAANDTALIAQIENAIKQLSGAK